MPNFTNDANNIARLNTSPTGDAGIAIDTNMGVISALITAINAAIATLQSSGDPTALKAAHNLSDLSNAATARTNLGLGSAAIANSSAFDASGAAATVNTALNTHAALTSAHGVAGTVVGTTDAQTITNKVISGASNTISAIAESSITNLVSDLAAKTPTTRTISTSGSLSGGGDLTANRTLAVAIPQPIKVTYDGGGSTISTGSGTKVFVQAQTSGTISAVTMIADQSGSCVLAIRKCPYANFPGSLASIVASAPPTLSSAQKSTDSTLTGWTTSITAGDILEISVSSATTVQRITCTLQIVGN